MKKIIHTPEGLRDVYSSECSRKIYIEKQIGDIFHLYGYRDIETPTFEFFEVFGDDIGTVSSQDLYKFFDREGHILALRPDITPSVARAVSTVFPVGSFPVRLCYKGNTFVNYSNYQGRPREVTQLGSELLGDDSPEADAEIIAMAAETLLSIGLRDFQISLGNVAYINSLMEVIGFTREETEQVVDFITNKNFFALEEFLMEKKVDPRYVEVFVSLGELTGGEGILKAAEKAAPNAFGVKAIERMEKIYSFLKRYGVEKYITFDLSMIGNYGYYTGVIFRAYTYGTGDAIIKGGRYDHLLEKFGRGMPSVGLAIVVDELLNALFRQHLVLSIPSPRISVIYTGERAFEAVKAARRLRGKGFYTELIKKDHHKTMKEYQRYGFDHHVGVLILFDDDESCQIYQIEREDHNQMIYTGRDLNLEILENCFS